MKPVGANPKDVIVLLWDIDDTLWHNGKAAIAAWRLAAQAEFGRNFDWRWIGDTPRDIMAARFIGALVLAVATGFYSQEALARYHPDGLLAGLPSADRFSAAVEKNRW